MDRLGDIRLFVEAAELGSLSAAGRKLNLTPAAASVPLMFSSNCRVSGWIPPGTSVPSGLVPRVPDTKMMFPTRTAGENGLAGGPSGWMNCGSALVCATARQADASGNAATRASDMARRGAVMKYQGL